MKVSGFSFIKNALKFDYPVVEAITSILPICDEFVVTVGKSEDKTLALIEGIDPKIKVVETEWDESLREGGRVLAVETDKAFAEVAQESDWAFYIQGDEVMHERYLPVVKARMEELKDVRSVDGLLFEYLHFYGSYDFVGKSSNWFEREIRVVRPNRSIHSHGDAQGFRKTNDEKLRVRPVDAYIYHYGWVKEPETMKKKVENFHRHWHDDKWLEANSKSNAEFQFDESVRDLRRFTEGHPSVMKDRVAMLNWDFEPQPYKTSLKDRSATFVKKALGVDLGYQNWVLDKP